jgi:tRNA (cytidine/uridine-2'-O-)-methyltransferase
LIEPLGFSISDKELKRAGLDYWDKVFLKLYPNWQAYLDESPEARRWLFTARGGTGLWDAKFVEGDHLVFGAEPTGLPPEILRGGSGSTVTIPMLEERRSLNLSTAVGIATYEALRQVQG